MGVAGGRPLDEADELVVEFGVGAAGGEELGVGASFDDAAPIEDEDGVGASDGAQAMGDDEGGSAGDEAIEGLLEAVLGEGIDGGGGLVENEESRVGEHGAGEADELALAEREGGASFADGGVEAFGEGGEEVEAAEGVAGLFCLRAGGVGPGEAEVVEDGAVEEEVVLADDGHLGAEGLEGEGLDGVAVEEDEAALAVVEARDEVDEGGLAGAGVSDEGDGLAGLGGEGEVVEDRAIGVVAEGDGAELDAGAEAVGVGRKGDG